MRKKVTNSKCFSGADSDWSKKILGKKGSLHLSMHWMVSGRWGEGMIIRGWKNVPGNLILSGFSSKCNSVTDWKGWGELLYLHSSWDQATSLVHMDNLCQQILRQTETVKRYQMSVLCSSSERKQNRSRNWVIDYCVPVSLRECSQKESKERRIGQGEKNSACLWS